MKVLRIIPIVVLITLLACMRKETPLPVQEVPVITDNPETRWYKSPINIRQLRIGVPPPGLDINLQMALQAEASALTPPVDLLFSIVN